MSIGNKTKKLPQTQRKNFRQPEIIYWDNKTAKAGIE